MRLHGGASRSLVVVRRRGRRHQSRAAGGVELSSRASYLCAQRGFLKLGTCFLMEVKEKRRTAPGGCFVLLLLNLGPRPAAPAGGLLPPVRPFLARRIDACPTAVARREVQFIESSGPQVGEPGPLSTRALTAGTSDSARLVRVRASTGRHSEGARASALSGSQQWLAGAATWTPTYDAHTHRANVRPAHSVVLDVFLAPSWTSV